MKLDIKSVLIGVLLGINIMLLMGSAPAPTTAEGKYIAVYHPDLGDIIIIDSTTGQYRNRIF